MPVHPIFHESATCAPIFVFAKHSQSQVGGVVGPYLGGILGSSGDYFLGARYAIFGSFAAVALVMLLPARLDTVQATAAPKKQENAAPPEAPETKSWSQQAALILGLVGLYLGSRTLSSSLSGASGLSSTSPSVAAGDSGEDRSID